MQQVANSAAAVKATQVIVTVMVANYLIVDKLRTFINIWGGRGQEQAVYSGLAKSCTHEGHIGCLVQSDRWTT